MTFMRMTKIIKISYKRQSLQYTLENSTGFRYKELPEDGHHVRPAPSAIMPVRTTERELRLEVGPHTSPRRFRDQNRDTQSQVHSGGGWQQLVVMRDERFNVDNNTNLRFPISLTLNS